MPPQDLRGSRLERWLAVIYALVGALAWMTGGDKWITICAPTTSLLESPVGLGHLTSTVAAYRATPHARHD